YVWTKSELQDIFPDDYELFAEYYNVNSNGYWENGNYILLRKTPDEKFVHEKNLKMEQLQEKVAGWKEKLLKARSKRVRPGLDDKTLTSWNALVIQGLTDAYKAFQDEKFLLPAEKNARFLKENVMTREGKLFHTWKNGKHSVDGFMEDYAILIQAFISLFEITGKKQWLEDAVKLLEYSIKHFFNAKNGLFYYSEAESSAVLTNHYQNEDNVIPAANSVMVNNLHKLYLILGEPQYLNDAKKMLQQIAPQFINYPMAFSNWGNLMLKLNLPFFEVVVNGAQAQDKIQHMQKDFRPNVLWAFAEGKSDISLLEGRFVSGKTLIYVCREGSCQLPLEKPEKALELIKS
ncbi:MAG: thioredoxin domain-containing protein, partial [Prolixibacteraceae bacterium]